MTADLARRQHVPSAAVDQSQFELTDGVAGQAVGRCCRAGGLTEHGDQLAALVGIERLLDRRPEFAQRLVEIAAFRRQPAAAGEQRRRLTLFFNKDARKSAADALKKASWLLAAANAYLGFAKESVAYLAVVIVGWDDGKVFRSFLKRGAILILLQFTLENLAWFERSHNPAHFLSTGVLSLRSLSAYAVLPMSPPSS